MLWSILSSTIVRRRSTLVLTAAIVLATSSCSAPPKRADVPKTPRSQAVSTAAPDAAVLWSAATARRQTAFVRMNLPIVIPGTRIDVGEPSGSKPWIAESSSISVFSSHIVRGSISGPAVDQLTGSPAAQTDAGSYLLPLASSGSGGKAPTVGGHFVVREPMPLFLKVMVSPLQEPGEYRFPITVALPGKAAEVALLSVTVSEVALPTDSRVLAVATTTTADLARIFPESFGSINARYLDRGDPAQKAAVEQLDKLVELARRNGVSLFVEDMGPQVKVDEVGRVSLNWDAYDRVMQPYMDGTAFGDRVPFATWLAPDGAVSDQRFTDAVAAVCGGVRAAFFGQGVGGNAGVYA